MAQAEVKKYYVSAYKEVEVNGKWYIKSTNFVIEAEDRTAAEWKVREKGYFPFSVIRAK